MVTLYSTDGFFFSCLSRKMSRDRDLENEPEDGVLRRHKPKQSDAEANETDEYQQLETFFRNKFAEEGKQKVTPQRQRTEKPSTKKEPPTSNSGELAVMYKKLLDQAISNISNVAKQTKPLTEAQLRRNKEASERMKSYHAKKKQSSDVPKQDSPKSQPKQRREEQSEMPTIPKTMHNYFTDLKRKR